MAKIVLSRDGALVTQRFLDESPVAIGRGASSDILVEDASLAPTHATICVVGNDYILEVLGEGDLAINGTPASRRILQHGDVVEIGSYSLKYVDSRAASDIDLERTMLIPGLRNVMGRTGNTQELKLPSVRGAGVRYPSAQVEWVAGPRRGAVHRLDRVIATFGTAATGLVVITRRPHGYFVTHVEGPRDARLGGETIGAEPRTLATGDVLELPGGESIRFTEL